MDFWSHSTIPSTWIALFMGLSSLFGTVFSSNSYLWDSVRLLAMGSVIETGRRLFQWFVDRFRFQYSITGQFNEGDPAYEWILLFLTQEEVWRRSRDFRVNAANSKRKWGVRPGVESVKDTDTIKGNADYVPTYEIPQIFRWKRKDSGQSYWVEIQRTKSQYPGMGAGMGHMPAGGTLFVTIYTLDMTALSALVEEARVRYGEVSRPNVTIHLADQPSYGPGVAWSHVKHKTRRPLSSIILQQGVLQSILQDAQEFIDTESWYLEAGIPHRRGYLLYGPPGTGKSSTIYALAGELGLEIYSLSLASGFVDDSFLQRAVSSIPKHSILLIEDIDCAFPSREELDFIEEYGSSGGMVTPGFASGPYPQVRRSSVSLSGLLNVIDGVGSEEGRLFFATTNYIDRIDPALMRPGRIDKKIEYQHATKEQALALFKRFFRLDGNVKLDLENLPGKLEPGLEAGSMEDLASRFASLVPQSEFTTAELQGFLLSCKKNPVHALLGISAWVEEEREDRAAKKVRDEKRKDKAEAAKAKRINAMRGMYAGPQSQPVVPNDVLGVVQIDTPPPTPTVGSEQVDDVPAAH